ncbi:MAG: hypothetical protein J6L89_06070 [Clostridia bacterium]|nr:hypothetical protein [Clostridia bacterium]
MKNIKKFISVLLALVLVLAPSTAGLTAFAAGEMTFTVSNVNKSKPGDVVTVTVKVSNSKPVCAVNPTVVYDADKLEFVSATNGDVFAKNAFQIGEAYEGKVRILYYNGLTNTSKNGTVCTLKFKVLSGATGYADVKLDFPENSVVNQKEEAVTFANKAGKVGIVSAVIYAGEQKKENAIEEKYYQKVPLFASYRKQSVQLYAGVIGEEVKKVEWSVDKDRLIIDKDGLVVPNRPWYCRANVTAKITCKSGAVYEQTVMVEFYKLAFTQRLPVF